MAVHPEDVFEVGMIVPDLDKAIQELSTVFGLTFTEIRDGTLPLRTADGEESAPRFRMCYSRQPPYLEVIEEVAGTRLVAPEGTELHHLGAWCDDVVQDAAELERRGFPMVSAGLGPKGEWPYKWSYHVTAAGTLIELLDRTSRESVMRIIDTGVFPVSALADVRGARPVEDEPADN